MNDQHPDLDTGSIRLPVPPAIASAWQALPLERRTALAQMIVEAWLEPLLRRPGGSPTLVPFYTSREEQDTAHSRRLESMRQSQQQLDRLIAELDARDRLARGEDGFDG